MARELGIPVQVKLVGRDTGTDAIASVFAGRAAAATSIGFPIRGHARLDVAAPLEPKRA